MRFFTGYWKTGSIVLFIMTLFLQAGYAEEKDHIVLPLRFIQNVPYVALTINGQTADFSFDTGSGSGLHLTEDWIKKIDNMHMLPEKARSIDMAGKVNYANQFMIPEMTVNGMKFTQIRAVELIPWGLFINKGKETGAAKKEAETNRNMMVLGLGLFRDKQILLNYADNTITIANAGYLLHDASSDWQEIPVTIANEGILIKLRQENRLYSFVVDTGASNTVTSSKTVRNLSTVPCVQAGLDVDTEETPCRAAIFDLSGVSVKTYVSALDLGIFGADISSLGQDGLIGTDFLQKHKMLIDMKTGKVWIDIK